MKVENTRYTVDVGRTGHSKLKQPVPGILPT